MHGSLFAVHWASLSVNEGECPPREGLLASLAYARLYPTCKQHFFLQGRWFRYCTAPLAPKGPIGAISTSPTL